MWTQQQIDRSLELEAQGAIIAFYCSDRNGLPANGGAATEKYMMVPGAIHEVNGPLELCTPRALHATMQPHRWFGTRVWVVAMLRKIIGDDNRLGSLRREVIGEILLEECISPQVLIRLKINFSGADFSGVYLSGAKLYKVNFSGANLSGANFFGADLSGVNLSEANLFGVAISKIRI